jgi:restriction endonuclease S subunit
MSSNATLKAGWTRIAFGDVVKLARERSSDPEGDGFERYVGLEHIDPGDFAIRRWGNVAAGTTFTNVFRDGQVLFGKRRAYQRKVAVADFDGICSGDIYVFESKSEHLFPGFLPFICQTDRFFEHAVGTSAGSLSPRTNWSGLADYEFVLPPLEAQRRLAVAFDALRICQESLHEVQRASEATRRSLLFAFFRPQRGPTDRFPKHWRRLRVGDAGDTQIGIRKHPGSLNGPNLRPYLRVANVLDGWIDWSEIMEIHVPDADLTRCALRDGDILINKGNSMNLVGRSAIFRKQTHDDCFFQDHLIRFRVRDDVDAGFAQAYFQHLLYTLQFTRIAVASTSIATIPVDRFADLQFPLPPLEEQRTLAGYVESAASATGDAERRIREARALLMHLSLSLGGDHS